MKDTKQCTACLKDKFLSDFYTYKTRVGGLEKYRKQCKECYVQMGLKSEKHRRIKNKLTDTRHCVGFCGQNKLLSQFDIKCTVCKECKKKGYLSQWIANIKNRVKSKGWVCEINAGFIQELFEKQGGKCALTKIPFTFNYTKHKSHQKDPFSPSIDRINPKIGYTKDNVRLVCMIVNLALNEFGDTAFAKMCDAFVNNNL